MRLTTTYGPARQYAPALGGSKPASVNTGEFSEAVRQVSQFCRTHGRIPDEVWIGAYSISPQDYLATLGAVIEGWKSSRTNKTITLLQGKFTADKYVAKDSLSLWGWVIFPEGFHAPKIMEIARLQAWTLKPASLSR